MQTITLEIVKATVVTGRGCDKITLHTTLPHPMRFYEDKEKFTLDSEITPGYGKEYLMKIGINESLIEVIEIPKFHYSFSKIPMTPKK